MNDPSAVPPSPVVPGKKNSLPPIYPKPLLALLGNAQSMATRPLKKDAWTKEHLIGPRADRYSEDAHLFGPFPKRREYNVQWRFHITETKKVLPPLEIAISPRKGGGESGEEEAQRPRYTESMPMQDVGLISEIETLVGGSAPAPLTRREIMARVTPLEPNQKPTRPNSNRHPSRWVRRRYRELLSKVPVLTYSPKSQGVSGEEGYYSIRQSDHASGKTPATDMNVREIDETNLAWLMHEGIGGGGSDNPQKVAKKRD